MGGAIDSSRADHVFVWSDKNETFNPQQSNAFYVNSVNGFGLNTRKPTTQLDIGKAGALKVALNRVHDCNAKSKGIVSYTLGADNQLKSFCGCDGKRWVPLA